MSRKALATPEGFVNMTAVPMLFTMGIAGIWHGAGLQYVVFGLLHGMYLTVNHGWRTFRHLRQPPPVPAAGKPAARALTQLASVALTFLCVLIAQVFFRAESCAQAVSVLGGMFGFHGVGTLAGLPGESKEAVAHQLGRMMVGFAIVWLLPNTQQILGCFKPALDKTVWDTPVRHARLLWHPNVVWALLLSGAFVASLVGMKDPSTFLYFQF